MFLNVALLRSKTSGPGVGFQHQSHCFSQNLPFSVEMRFSFQFPRNKSFDQYPSQCKQRFPQQPDLDKPLQPDRPSTQKLSSILIEWTGKQKCTRDEDYFPVVHQSGIFSLPDVKWIVMRKTTSGEQVWTIQHNFNRLFHGWENVMFLKPKQFRQTQEQTRFRTNLSRVSTAAMSADSP